MVIKNFDNKMMPSNKNNDKILYLDAKSAS